MKKNIIIIFLSIIFFFGFKNLNTPIVNTLLNVDLTDITLVSTNTGEVWIGSNQNVALFMGVDDTARVNYIISYKAGNSPFVALAQDSIVTRSTALTGKGFGKVLRGYGLATDLIPGATVIKVTATLDTALSESPVNYVIDLISE